MLSIDDIFTQLGGQAKIAASLGLFRNAPAKWRHRGVPARYVHQIAQALGVSVHDIPTASTSTQGAKTTLVATNGGSIKTPATKPQGTLLMTAYVPELYLDAAGIDAAKAEAGNLESWTLTPRQLCDIELLLNGGFAPLKGFMNEADYDSVVDSMRTTDGTLFPIPITLDVNQDFADKAAIGSRIALRDLEGVLIAILNVESNWQPAKAREAEKVFGADDQAHPAVHYLHNVAGSHYLGGSLEGVEAPIHYDFRAQRHSPNELRALFEKWGWKRVVAFQTRNPLHRAHQELTLRAAKQVQANLLIHPIVGMTKPGDVDHYTRVRCYQAILESYPDQTTTMSLLGLAMRMAGPREALWHGIIRKNYGATHFIVGRDHAGPGKNSQGDDFYGPYDAQDLFVEYQDEIGIEMVPFKMMVYIQERAEYVPVDEVKEGETQLHISGTEVRRRLNQDLEIPSWFSPPEVQAELKKAYPPLNRRGFTVFFTGLSGSGKSTVANALMVKLMELGGRPCTLLDGDVVRTHLSSELGFSKEHRDLNIQRIGYVASEISKNGGIAICAPIAPYSSTRKVVRDMIEGQQGVFIEVHVATPLEVCEGRDRKGLYALARAGKIKGFTGIDDPYEAPVDPELRLDTSEITPDEAAHQVMLQLQEAGLI